MIIFWDNTRRLECVLVLIQEYLYKMKLEDMKKHERKENEYYVTDLVRCPLKRVYEEKYPELILGQAFDPTLLLGDIVHMGLEAFIEKLFSEGYMKGIVGVEVENSKKVGGYVIKGRIDALLEVDDGRIGIEIKYSRRDLGLPHRHHVLQARIYNWLFDLDKTILIYLTPERIAEFEIADKVGEEELLKLIGSSETPRWSWECQYCFFAILCPKKKS